MRNSHSYTVAPDESFPVRMPEYVSALEKLPHLPEATKLFRQDVYQLAPGEHKIRYANFPFFYPDNLHSGRTAGYLIDAALYLLLARVQNLPEKQELIIKKPTLIIDDAAVTRKRMHEVQDFALYAYNPRGGGNHLLHEEHHYQGSTPVHRPSQDAEGLAWLYEQAMHLPGFCGSDVCVPIPRELTENLYTLYRVRVAFMWDSQERVDREEPTAVVFDGNGQTLQEALAIALYRALMFKEHSDHNVVPPQAYPALYTPERKR